MDIAFYVIGGLVIVSVLVFAVRRKSRGSSAVDSGGDGDCDVADRAEASGGDGGVGDGGGDGGGGGD